MGASALLYLGPLLAGLSGMGWDAVPVFIALFALWLVVMRPKQWPRDLSQWTQQTAVAAAAQVAVNALIVVVLFGIGRGISGVSGVGADIPAVLPVALSFLSTPLSRLVWDPVKGQAMDDLLDSAISQINNPSTSLRPAANGDDMVRTLLDLPGDSDAMLTADALAAALTGPATGARLMALEDALDMHEPNRRALREAVILWATDPARDVDTDPHGAQDIAFNIAGSDPVLLHLFAYRALPLLWQKPALWASYPTASKVEIAIDVSQPAGLQSALHDLGSALRKITPDEFRDDETA